MAENYHDISYQIVINTTGTNMHQQIIRFEKLKNKNIGLQFLASGLSISPEIRQISKYELLRDDQV